MTRAVHSFIFSPRFLHCLTRFAPSDQLIAKDQYPERFGKLVDLKGAMTLSKTVGGLSTLPFDPVSEPPDDFQKKLLAAHGEMVRFVATSFLPRSGPVKNKLPSSAEYHSHCRFTGVYDTERSESPDNYTAAYDPYRKFYIYCQTYIANTVHRFRSQVRQVMKGLSAEAAKLSFLDEGIDNALFLRSGELLGKIPDLLGRRFMQLLDAHWQELPVKIVSTDLEKWMTPGGWIWVFTMDMKELLLAEIEMRLLPVLGLVETI